MKNLKTISIILALICILSLPILSVNADENADQAYVSIVDGNGDLALVYKEVDLVDCDNDTKITINDILYKAHEEFYEGGAQAGYATAETQFGLSLAKLWGKENGSGFGYYMNDASATSLLDEVKAGDHIKAFVYTDTVAFSDTYSFFDKNTAEEAELGDEVTLMLKIASYDMTTWAPITLPVAGAKITVNGEETSYVTDENGSVTVKLEESGSIVISADSDTVNLVAPAFKVKVKGDKASDDSGASDEAADDTKNDVGSDKDSEKPANTVCIAVTATVALVAVVIVAIVVIKRKKA